MNGEGVGECRSVNQLVHSGVMTGAAKTGEIARDRCQWNWLMGKLELGK
jgi:hypothetical protein